MLLIAGNIAAYIAALQAHLAVVAGGVGIIATLVVVAFALLFRRLRERVNIAAVSLDAIESRVADLLDLPELRTTERISAGRSRWRTTAVRMDIIYGVLAIGFLAAGSYAFFIA